MFPDLLLIASFVLCKLLAAETPLSANQSGAVGTRYGQLSLRSAPMSRLTLDSRIRILHAVLCLLQIGRRGRVGIGDRGLGIIRIQGWKSGGGSLSFTSKRLTM